MTKATREIPAENADMARAGLPDGWRWVKLGALVSLAQHGFATGERDAGGVIQVRMNNVTTLGQFDWASLTRVPADPELVERYRLQAGDVLFNNTNSAELVGKTALFDGHDEPVVFSNHFTRVRANPEALNPRFLALWLQQQWQSGAFAAICNRWIGQSAIQRPKLLALEIPLPPLAEQKRIAEILKEQMAATEQLRRALAEQLETINKLPAALLREAFTGGL
jgi:type I restriction enzyme S subunit